MNNQEITNYSRANVKAMSFINQAALDYVSGRCCIVNGLPTGLILCAQAVEKLLKAYLLLNEKTKDVRRYQHKLPDLLNAVSCVGIHWINQYSDLSTRL